MSKFGLGDKVKNTNTGEVGYIIRILPPHRGMQMYKVKYDDRENDEKSRSLILDVDLTDAFERIRLNMFGHYNEYLKDNTAFKIKSSNNIGAVCRVREWLLLPDTDCFTIINRFCY